MVGSTSAKQGKKDATHEREMGQYSLEREMGEREMGVPLNLRSSQSPFITLMSAKWDETAVWY